MFRKPAFWIALTALALASGVFALWLFPQAFPIVQLDLRMDREAALAAARETVARQGLGPRDSRQAASFTSDTVAQTFVELEGGGKDAFAQMLRDGLYAAYTWRVRFFNEGQKHETLVRFRPDGRAYGFIEQVEETAPGAALSAAEARPIAERTATQSWLVDLSPFALVEESRERRASGRVDHTFTYERSAPTLNEGRYRLRLVVTGDRLTEVSHFIKIPEAFSRRYEEMRSANEAIGAAGSVAMFVLYVGGGIGIGLFWLLRHRWVIVRPAVQWGMAVALLQLLAAVNAWPLQWMTYDTALPLTSYISQQVAIYIASFVGFATLFSLSFMAAESLTRRAFGSHPQLWKVWSRDAAASRSVLGRTVAGYLFVPMFFAYDVLLYFFATRWFGWWTPSEALIHPDILATYLPWLSAIAASFQAGFWEEALFRAVPIAGAALIGDRFGRRRLFIIIAFVIQTIIFGAGHAAYPTQPSYARPVELILPSLAFGLMYLRFGLLPAVVLHYAFDVVWMALPLFVSSASDIWVDRTMVIVLTLVPLWVVLGPRLRAGRWLELPAEYRNAAWSPSAPDEPSPVEAARPAVVPISARVVGAWLVAGVAAGIIWVVVAQSRTPVPPLEVSRADAARVARDALASRGVSLGPEWRILPIVDSGRTEAHAFVWQVGGRERFLALLGRYLPTPRWQVRMATFEGDVDTRAEEWVVLVNHRGEAERVAHQIPESRPGAALAEGDARRLALQAIQETLHIPPSSLHEVSAQPSKLTARTDWTFTFQDLTVDPIPLRTAAPASLPASDAEARGEARVEVGVAGDEVARVRPFLRVPEAWQRERRARDTVSQIVNLLATLVAGTALVTAAVTGLIAWSRRRYFARGVASVMFAAFIVTSLVVAINRWPSTIATLSTARPFELQVAMLVGFGLIALLLPGAMVGLAAGTLPDDMRPRRAMTSSQAAALGVSLGLIATAGFAVARAGGELPWPDVSPLGSYVPFIAAALGKIPPLLLRTITLLVLLTAIEDFTHGWTRRRMIFGLLLVVTGALLGAPASDSLTMAQWAGAAALAGIGLLCAYLFVLRHDLSVTPLAMATIVSMGLIREGMLNGFNGALVGSIAGVVVTAITAWWLLRLLRRARHAAVE